jgi:hypothetical protein
MVRCDAETFRLRGIKMPHPKYREPDFEDSEYEDDWYDRHGNPDPNGAYDAGGHMDGERAAAAADWIRDQMRDRDI